MMLDPKLDPSRLDNLAATVRKARATSAGLNDGLHDLRDTRRDLKSRIAQVQSLGAAGGPVARQSAEQQIAGLEVELADLGQRIEVSELEQGEAAQAASAARANLKTAVTYARELGWTIPAAVAEALQ